MVAIKKLRNKECGMANSPPDFTSGANKNPCLTAGANKNPRLTAGANKRSSPKAR